MADFMVGRWRGALPAAFPRQSSNTLAPGHQVRRLMAGFQNEEVMTIQNSTKSWADQNAEGDDEATRLITEARDTENPMLLIGRLRAMSANGMTGGQTTGFVFRLAEAAMKGI